MADRIQLLNTVRTKLDALAAETESYRVRKDGDRTTIQRLFDELLVYLRENFARDDAILATFPAKPRENFPSSKAFKPHVVPTTWFVPLTADQQVLCEEVSGFFGGDTRGKIKFEPEAALSLRDSAVAVLAMRELFSTIGCPVDTESDSFSKFSDDFAGLLDFARRRALREQKETTTT